MNEPKDKDGLSCIGDFTPLLPIDDGPIVGDANADVLLP
jgi:hypothetical protein